MLASFIVAPILIAVFLYLFPVNKSARFIAVLTQIAISAFAFWLFSETRQGEIFITIGNYQSVLGINLRADFLAAMFVFLTTFIFLIATIYSFNANYNRLFWFLLFIWQGALIGIFFSADLFNIFILMEVATVIIAVLIMYDRLKRVVYDGMIYFAVNIIVMQFYLFGLGYIYRLTGTVDMYLMAERINAYHYNYLILPYAMMMTFIALKCALVPLFGWLPKAHGSPAAPPAVSAILSALHIKSAIYMFIRLQDLFELVASSQFFLVIGIITGIVGFILAMSQSDIKLILAYHTVSQVGLIFTGLNIGSSSYAGGYSYSFVGGLYHIINHALFKGGLFLSAGLIATAYGTRNVYKIRGLLKQYPILGIATLMAILGIAGAPFFNGSISKYFLVSDADTILNGILIFMSLGTIISFIKYSTILFGKADLLAEPVKISLLQQIPVLVMGMLCFITGIFGVQAIHFLFDITVAIDIRGYLEKTVIFFISLAAGILIFKYYVKNSALLKRIKGFDLGFRGMVLSVGIFFTIILIVVGIIYQI